MDNQGRGETIRGAVGFLPLLLVIYITYQFISYRPVTAIEWNSVFSEGVVALFLLLALFLTNKLKQEKPLYWPLALGFTALLISDVTDVLDEFLQQPEWVTMLLEDTPQLLGYPFVVLGLFRWGTVNAQLHAELQRQAVTDYLTGALNRRGFMEQFEYEISRSKRYGSPLSLIWFDLDNFKQINDRFGHHAGDEVLRVTSRTTRDHLRQVDILGRMGGEEFCIMMPETRLGGAADVAEKLRKAIESCDCLNGISITASFGVGEYLPGEDSERLLKRVDAALYRAKQNGRNCIVQET